MLIYGKRPIIKTIKESGAETFRPFFICTVLYRAAAVEYCSKIKIKIF
nr:MAG TPA: hypothetical protein [Caudoviricetes sp.]